MLPDTETLKSLLSDLQTSGAGSRLRVATRTIESMRVELLAEVIRLREQLNPTTPAGKLAAYRAAQTFADNPPKIADEWRRMGETSAPWQRRSAPGFVLVAANQHCYRLAGDTKVYPVKGGLTAVLDAADKALAAAGWELVGGAE